MKKNDLIKEILGMGYNSTKSKLNQMNIKQLNEIHESLKIEPSEGTEDQAITEESIKSDNGSDIEEMKEQIRQEAIQEAKEMLRKEMEEEVKDDKPKLKTQVDRNRMVDVMSVTEGTLVYRSKRSGQEWEFNEYGAVDTMDVAELMAMRSGQQKFLNEPFILILDDEVVEFLGFKVKYESMNFIEDIDSVFRKKNDEFKVFLESLPRGIQTTILSRAKKLVDEKKLDSTEKIRYMEEKFKVDLT